MISVEAVEVAAAASYEQVRPLMGFPSGFDEAPEPLQETYRGIVRAALEAAAPHMLQRAKAEAWDEGKGAMYAEMTGHEPSPNPYRSAS